LVSYGPRYADVVRTVKPAFRPPTNASTVSVIERIDGNATTDFGAPDGIAECDTRPIDPRELTRLRSVLEACWTAFDRIADDARGVSLKKGPRGGGREVHAIVEHVLGAEAGYLGRFGLGRPNVNQQVDRPPTEWRDRIRASVIDGLTTAVNEGQPDRGPRGGAIWTPRRFLRRAAWHVLDHAWEIEDRSDSD
jgi:hypothetical protein